MPVTISRGPQPEQDDILAEIVGVLERYSADHPTSVVEVYRHGQYAVRIRVTDPRFTGWSKTDRHNSVWPYLSRLPDDVLGDVYLLICVTPEEKATSFASMEFDDPIPAAI